MVVYCCAYGCKETFVKGGQVTFHRFPKDVNRRKLWEAQLKRANFHSTESTKICSKHFEEDCFDKTRFGGTWLKPDAIPTKFDFPDHLVKQKIEGKSPKKRICVNQASVSEAQNSVSQKGGIKRKFCLGDFEENDMASPTKARKVLCVAKEQKNNFAKRLNLKKIKIQLKGKIGSLTSMLNELRGKRLISNSASSVLEDIKVSREVKGAKLVTKENSKRKSHICDEYDEEENERFNITELADINVNKIPALPSLSQLNLHSFTNKNISEGKLLTVESISKVERLDSKNLITGISDKENSTFNFAQDQNICTLKRCFTYENLVESIPFIKKPNLWWTVFSSNNFIICARWNKEYIAEKRVVIENTLTIRVFSKEMEVNITDFMDITCIEDISNLLERVENYSTSVDSDK